MFKDLIFECNMYVISILDFTTHNFLNALNDTESVVYSEMWYAVMLCGIICNYYASTIAINNCHDCYIPCYYLCYYSLLL